MRFHLQEAPRVVKFTETGSGVVGARGGEGGGGLVFDGDRASTWEREEALEVDGGHGHTTSRMYVTPPHGQVKTVTAVHFTLLCHNKQCFQGNCACCVRGGQRAGAQRGSRGLSKATILHGCPRGCGRGRGEKWAALPPGSLGLGDGVGWQEAEEEEVTVSVT